MGDLTKLITSLADGWMAGSICSAEELPRSANSPSQVHFTDPLPNNATVFPESFKDSSQCAL
jgi:hypothetical protein